MAENHERHDRPGMPGRHGRHEKKGGIRITFNAPVVLSFAIVSLLALLLKWITKGWTNDHLFMTYRSSMLNPMTYIRLFTHIIGHVDFKHYIGNMAYILLLGPMLEEKYGSKRILAIMAATGVITGIVYNLFFPGVGLCGASGVVFAFILMTSFTSFREGELPLSFILVAVIYLGQQVYEGVFAPDNNVANLAHVLGGIVGALVGWIFNRRPKEKKEE